MLRILDDLPALLHDLGASSIQEIVGTLDVHGNNLHQDPERSPASGRETVHRRRAG
jgi:hypothetical protein